MPDISLTTTEFKALSSESRTSILKILKERNHTLSELSAKTGMAAPTIKQHATILIESGLIELKDEGRKWKYYSLTRKGKDLLDSGASHSTNIMLIFSAVGTIAIAGILFMILAGTSMQPIGSTERISSNDMQMITENEVTGSEDTLAMPKNTTEQNNAAGEKSVVEIHGIIRQAVGKEPGFGEYYIEYPEYGVPSYKTYLETDADLSEFVGKEVILTGHSVTREYPCEPEMQCPNEPKYTAISVESIKKANNN